MYKLLLCQRYLRTRYIALASIISVTLGVATMIVVNSVMAGFGTEMRSRIQGILSDIIINTRGTNGVYDAEGHKDQIRKLVGKYIAGVTATVEVHAILSYQHGGDNWIPHPVILVGIDPESKSEVGPLTQYLTSYQERTDGGQKLPPERSMDEKVSWELTPAVMAMRRERAERVKEMQKLRDRIRMQQDPDAINDDQLDLEEMPSVDAPLGQPLDARLFIGTALANFQDQDPETQATIIRQMIRPGDDVKLTTYTSGTPKEVHLNATVIDTFRTGMADYDANLVYCNIEYLQYVRKMLRHEDGVGAFTQLQIKLKDYKDAPKVVEILRSNFAPDEFDVKTWEERQGMLLAAVDVESSILNILLFLIIMVAGFGILAIFFMIVVEKTRDIGILKALGASSNGVMSIFLSYGLLLGMVGAGAGVGAGLLFVHYINQIEGFVTFVTGRKVFPEKIYYFKDIPTYVDPLTVVWVTLGAVMIAVLASVLPARRAARLRPVQALRYE